MGTVMLDRRRAASYEWRQVRLRYSFPRMSSILCPSLSRIQARRSNQTKGPFKAAVCVSLALLAFPGVAAAQTAAGEPQSTPLLQRCRTLGAAGLLAKFGSYGTFGAVQNRVGQSRSEIEASRLPGAPSTGYSDDSSQLIIPADLLTPLFDSPTSFLKIGGSTNLNRSRRKLTHVDVDTFRTEAEYLWSPTPAGFFGCGAFIEQVNIDMLNTRSTVDDKGRGFRADIVRLLGAHWGVAARVEYTWIDQALRSPTPTGRTFACDQKVGRLYSQADLVGSYAKDTWSWIPEGWLLRPTLGAAGQRTRFETARSNFGSLVSGTVGPQDDYFSASGALRLERSVRGPSLFAPFIEAGFEREIVNDLNAKVDDPNIVHTTLGWSSTLGRRARLDVEYNRYDGFHGQRRAQSLTTHIGVSF